MTKGFVDPAYADGYDSAIQDVLDLLDQAQPMYPGMVTGSDWADEEMGPEYFRRLNDQMVKTKHQRELFDKICKAVEELK